MLTSGSLSVMESFPFKIPSILRHYILFSSFQVEFEWIILFFFFFFPKFTQKHAYSVLAQKSLSLFISSNSPHPCRMIRNLVTGPLACSINGAVLFFSQHSKFFWWLLTAKVTDHIA